MRTVRHSLRSLLQAPGFTTVAILTLAIGIGANTAMFSVINAVLLASLPYPRPDRLVQLWEQKKDGGAMQVSGMNARDWRDQNRSLADLAWFYTDDISLSGGAQPQRIRVGLVSEGFFRAIGVNPSLGRLTAESDHRLGAPQVALLGHAVWQKQFAGRSDVVGRTIHLNGSAFTVVGVLPPGFDFPENAALWIPLEIFPDRSTRSAHNYRVVARMKDGLSFAQVHADLERVAANLARAYIDNKDHGIHVVPLYDQIVGPVRPAILILLAAVGFVLLIACVNIANLQLARGWNRVREMAVRTALGASRGRLIAELLTESLLLAVFGGVAGLLLAWWSIGVLRAAIPPSIPRVEHLGIDGVVLAFTLAVSVAAGLVFGLLPAFSASHVEVSEALKSGGAKAGMSRRRRRLGSGLAVAEIAIAVMLLAGAALLIETFRNLRSVDTGFQASGVIASEIAWPVTREDDLPRAERLSRALLDRVRDLPRMSSVALAGDFPFRGFLADGSFEIEGRPLPPDPHDAPDADYVSVSTRYFETLGIPLLRGRDFQASDELPASPLVAVVNQAFAKEFFPGQNVIGRRIRFLGFDLHPDFLQIVGIVGDVRARSLARPAAAAVFVDFFQHSSSAANPILIFRAPWSETAAVRRVVSSLDPNTPVEFLSAGEVITEAVSRQRFQMALLTVFAALALALAAIGIYGVQSYAVSRRTSEMGVRVAVGATRTDLLRLVVRESLSIAAAGLALGCGAALLLTRAMSALLFGVKPNDLLAYAGAVLVLGSVAVLASLLPARRAARVDPLTALRYE